MAILILHILLRQNSNLLLSYTYSSNEQQIIYIYIVYKKRDYISFRQTPVAEIAQLGERQTEDLKVPGSNPESLHEL